MVLEVVCIEFGCLILLNEMFSTYFFVFLSALYL